MAYTKKIIVVFLFTFLIIAFNGCHPMEQQLYGTYISNEKTVSDTILLYKDHHYIHKLQVKDGLKIQKGIWDYSWGTIRLYDFKSYAQDLPIESGTRITDVNITFNGSIEINSDSDINYIKVKD